jgi:hypothetical protein
LVSGRGLTNPLFVYIDFLIYTKSKHFKCELIGKSVLGKFNFQGIFAANRYQIDIINAIQTKNTS